MIKKHLLKIICLLIIVGLNWTGLLAIGKTFAYFSDTENSSGNTFAAGILDFSLSDTNDNLLTSPLFNISEMQKGESQQKIIRIKNDGTLDFQYKVNLTNVSGDLCGYLTLKAELDGSEKYNNVVQNTSFPTDPIVFSLPNDDWTFTLTLSNDAPESETCTFDFVFDGVQIGGVGFSNQETISNTVTAGTWVVPTNTWVQTTQADFESGVLAGVDTTTNPGDVMLSGAYSVDNNTVALWHLNEGSGSTAYDETTNNNDGTINGGVWTSGKYNDALEFDGGDDYVNCGNDASLNIRYELTIEAWIKPDTVLKPYYHSSIVDRGNSYWFLILNTGKLAFLRFNQDDPQTGYGRFSIFSTTATIPTGTWTHVAATYSVSGGNAVKLYINGQLSGAGNFANGPIDSSSSALTIGNRMGLHNFDGKIDEVRISNVARTSFPVSYFNSGTLESQSFDSGKIADWQSLEWDETTPTGTDITLEVATSNDGSTWSGWQLSSGTSPINLTSLPETQYIKWRATLTTTDASQTPILHEVRVIYYPGTASEHIVLNEFLPNPSGTNPDYGFDFGEDNDLMPKGEWVEIYNKSGGKAVDLAGWYIKDQEGKIVYLTSSNTDTGSTVINSGEWLVVYMNGEMFNNDGDTVYLYDMFNNLIDSYSYDLSSYCTLKPTLGDENDETPSGSCPTEIPGNKSYARIPDGSANWVDPIPTPGAPNKLEEEKIEKLEPEPEPEITESSIEEATTTTTTIFEQTTTATTIPDLETATTTITITIPDNVSATISTTTVDFDSSLSTSTTTTTISEETATTTTTTTTIPEETATTTTVPPTTTTTTTTEPPVEETITITTTIPDETTTTTTTTTTTEPPAETTTTTITVPDGTSQVDNSSAKEL